MHSNKGYQYKICKKYQLGTIDRAEYTATCIPQYTLMDNIVYMWDDFLNTCTYKNPPGNANRISALQNYMHFCNEYCFGGQPGGP